MGAGGQRHAPVALPPEKDLLPMVQEAGWALGAGLAGAGILSHSGIRYPERPV